MIRMLIIISSAFFFQVFLGALSVVFHVSALPFLILPVVTIYSAYHLGVVESLIVAICVGIGIDALAMMPIGVNLFWAVLLWLLSHVIASWLGRPNNMLLFCIIALSSFVYRLGLWLTVLVVWGQAESVSVITLFFAPLVDAGFGIMSIRIWSYIFALLKIALPFNDETSIRLDMK